MRLVLTGRNLDITPALRHLIERRLKKLDRLLNDSVISTQVVLTLEKYRHITEITLHARGDHMLHGIGDAATWQLSTRQAVEKISQQAHKLKDKWETRKRRATAAKALGPAGPASRDTAQPAKPRIVRAARYPVKPMSIEDAALKVDSGREAFLVFRNASTDSINILYRRKDGHLGLIEPEV
jgi:putative sigma-54 modulation protein